MHGKTIVKRVVVVDNDKAFYYNNLRQLQVAKNQCRFVLFAKPVRSGAWWGSAGDPRPLPRDEVSLC